MTDIRICSDLEECRHIWHRAWPKECFFDIWQVRTCFLEAFNRTPSFLLAEEKNRLLGLLALSWIEEEGYFGHFPGETWAGKTWIEQNKIIAADPDIARQLVAAIPGPAHLRYLCRPHLPQPPNLQQPDEIGYIFLPGQYGYCFADYMAVFSGKSRKKLRKELSALEAFGISFHHDRLSDVEAMFAMNRETFGPHSYFHDSRFLCAFEQLIAWLWDNGMLRITNVSIGGKTAAVDIGAIWHNTYTLLAGGTSGGFPGVAKLINLHHIERACLEHIEVVDFLCGDFNWKERFHLTPRPLYALQNRHKCVLRHEQHHEVRKAVYA